MVKPAFVLPLLVVVAGARAGAEAQLPAKVTVAEVDYEGRAHFRVTTPEATWFYDRAGGGFSRLVDRDARDWISFHKEPLSKFPDSVGAGYRGIPNLVFGQDNPDAGAGHPGFDQCDSTLVASNLIRTVSKSGRWSPAAHYWGTDQGGPNRERPDIKHQHFDRWRWAYFGDEASPRVLFIAQQELDELPDTLWYLGAENGGAITATNGMIVFGLGRGSNTTAHFRGAGQEFVLGFLEDPAKDAAAHRRIAATIHQTLSTKP